MLQCHIYHYEAGNSVSYASGRFSLVKCHDLHMILYVTSNVELFEAITFDLTFISQWHNPRLCSSMSKLLISNGCCLYLPFVYAHEFIKTFGTSSYVCLCLQLASQSQSHYFEPESRDWRGRSGQSTSFGDERSWDTIRENKESNNLDSGHQEIRQLNKQGSQFSSNTQVSSIQAVIYLLDWRNVSFLSCSSSYLLYIPSFLVFGYFFSLSWWLVVFLFFYIYVTCLSLLHLKPWCLNVSLKFHF